MGKIKYKSRLLSNAELHMQINMDRRNYNMFSVQCAIGLLAIICVSSLKNVSGNLSQQMSDATTQFSLDLLKEVLHDKPGNAIVSPVSLSILLAMLQQGARNNSRTELNNVLHALPDQTKEGYHNLTTEYQQIGGPTTLEFACRAFVGSEHSILPDFKQLLVSDFLSDIESVNFADSAGTSQHINSWVAQSTHNRITKLFEPDAFTSDTFMVLANAIYFMGRWKEKFYQIENKTFSPKPNEEKQIPSMYQEEYYVAGIDSDLGAKWVHMALKYDSKFTTLLVLPTERHGLESLINRLTPGNLTTLFSHNAYKEVKLTLPKFSLNTDSELIPVLMKLGLHDIFEHSAALPGITPQHIEVSKVVQKAEIAVDENGVTASAATGLEAVLHSAVFYPSAEELIFTADEPFLFFIVDRDNSVPLFAGRVNDPSSS